MKMHLRYTIICLFIMVACRQAYEPPVIKAPNRYLVVEGVINATPGSITTINLSRTRNLLDTFLTDPVSAAQIQIESGSGGLFFLHETAAGRYISDPLTLNPSHTYRLKIQTVDGKSYLSDFVPLKISPAIDSITWRQDKDVTIYANTHDPLNNTRYYRWDFTETWQYRSVHETDLGWSNGLIFFIDPANQIYNCWNQAESKKIALGSSLRLSEDVIDHAPVTVIPQHSDKIGIRYSILVRQYAMTEEAYRYWEILQKNTQQLGTLFDAQPSQLKGNIRNANDAEEPVIGFVSVSTVQQQRIFIAKSQLTDWTGGFSSIDCALIFTPQNPTNYLILNYPDTSYGPYYFTSSGSIALAKKICLDCRRLGGTNQKPSFW
ncbi:MAG TPA: DUF4249 domain-containing protein [Chitinophagaceae bacterium]